MRPRNQINTKSEIAKAVLITATASRLTDSFMTTNACVGQNFMGRLRKGASYDLPSIERLARVLGYRLSLTPIPQSRLTALDRDMAAARAKAPKVEPMHFLPVPAELRDDMRNLTQRKGFKRAEAAKMLGIEV